MGIVYGKIGKTMYRIEINDLSIVGKKVDSVPAGAERETPLTSWYGRLPSKILKETLKSSRVIFPLREVKRLRESGTMRETVLAEMYKFYSTFGEKGKELRYDFNRIEDAMSSPCAILSYLHCIVLHGSNTIAIFEPEVLGGSRC